MVKRCTILIALALVVSGCSGIQGEAVTKTKLNKKKVSLKVGEVFCLKVNKAKKKAKWTVKSGKKCVKLTRKKKQSVKIHGVRKGDAKVQCKVDSKKFYCKIKVISKSNPIEAKGPNPVVTSIPSPTSYPTVEKSQPTTVPNSTVEKNGSDVAVLQSIIIQQKEAGANVDEDLNSQQYEWSDEGRLTKITWDNVLLKGAISLAGLEKLQTFSCNNGEVTSLDVSTCYSLKYLYCKGNSIRYLDVQSQSYFIYIECDEGVQVRYAPE